MKRTERKRPFFVYYPMILPHWPFEPTPGSPDWDPTFRRGDKREKNRGMRRKKHFVDMVAYVDRTTRLANRPARTATNFTGGAAFMTSPTTFWKPIRWSRSHWASSNGRSASSFA